MATPSTAPLFLRPYRGDVPTPDFVLRLRERIGHDLLWLPGVTAVVHDPGGLVLAVRRADSGRWTLPSGIPDPGEEMAAACAREVLEETGVTVVVDRLLLLATLSPTTYPNGDVCQFVDHTFVCRAVAGEAHVADDESVAVAWLAPRDLDRLDGHAERARLAAGPNGPTRFTV